MADDVGETWFATLGSIIKVSSQQLERAFLDPRLKLDYQVFDAVVDAGPAPWGGSAERGPDGRLWFIAGKAPFWIDPHRLHKNHVPPPVIVESLTAGERVYHDVIPRTLVAGTSNVEIDYTALSLQSPDRVRFRYQLEGIDKNWVDAGTRRQAFYTQLGPGDYRFHVIAANNDGVWNNTGASLDFSIPPTFVQSRTFAALVIISLLGLIWLAYSLRVQQITARVRGRLEERLSERERIARELHDTLLQGFQGVILRFQSVADRVQSEPHLAHRLLEETLERADSVLVEGRDRIRDLRTADETSDDLAQLLTKTAEGAAISPSTNLRVTVEGTPRDLHPIVREETVRIAREAIFNAIQHARPKNIEISIVYQPRQLCLQIRDDGVGIDPAILEEQRREGHYGLVGMRERAEKIHGQLSLASRPGAGTEVKVTVPGRVAYADSSGPAWRFWQRFFSLEYQRHG